MLLSDFSAGMLDQARQNLAGKGSFGFKVIDAQSIPLQAGQFDAVIANHMLYHVPDRPAALSEIRRVLQPAGVFYAATNGERHLSELRDLLCKFDARLAPWGVVATEFTLENGAAQLSEWFKKVDLHSYEDALDVTEVEPLVEYVLSGWAAHILGKKPARFKQYVTRALRAHAGVFHITKQAGLFVCSQK
jgi:ubiquinone/menaquinone biosynthesis C-methylase UbiE